MTAATENATPSTPSSPPPAKKRRWLKITLISLAALLLLVLILPTLLSWFGKGMILGQVNKRIMGRVEADSISLGWFSGAKIYGVKLVAPDGSVVANLPAVTTGLTVLGALGSSMDFGAIDAKTPQFSVLGYDDGSTNLEKAVAPRNPTPPDPAAKPALMMGHFKTSGASATVAQPGSPTVAIENADIDALFDTSGQRPLKLTYTSSLRVGDRRATPLKADADISLLKNGRLRDIGEIVGHAALDAGRQDAAVIGPLVKRLGFTMKPGGTFDCKVSFDAPTAGKGVLDAPLILNGTAVTDKGQEVELTDTQLLFKGMVEGNAINFVAGSGLKSKMLTLTVLGSISKEKIDVRGEIEPAFDQIATLASKQLPEGTTVKGKHRTQYHIYGTPTLTGLTLDPQSKTAFTVDEVSIPSQGIRGTGRIGLSMQAGRLYVTTSDAIANDGRLQLVGYLDLAAEKPAFVVPQRTEVVVNAQINKPLGDKLLVWLPATWGLGDNAAAKVSGQISLTLDESYVPLNWQEFLKHGKLKGRVAINNFATESPLLGEMGKLLGPFAQMAPVDLGWRAGNIPPVEFEIREGRVYYRDLTIALPAMTVTFSGDVGLDFTAETGAPLNMTVALKHKNFPAPVLFALKGTTKKHQLVLDEKTVQKTIENVAPKLIDDVLKKKGFKLPGQ